MFKYFRQQLYVRLGNLKIAKSIDSSRTRLSEPLQGIFGTVLDSQQFARVYIPLRRRVTASISVLRVLVHSNPTTPIVSRLRKAVLSRIIRLHGIIAYTRRGQRTPDEASVHQQLHYIYFVPLCSGRAGSDLWGDWYTRRKRVARDWKSIRFSRETRCVPLRNVTCFSLDGSSFWLVDIFY